MPEFSALNLKQGIICYVLALCLPDIVKTMTDNDVNSFDGALEDFHQLSPDRILDAVEQVCAAGIMTPDVGGTATTSEVTDAVVEAIRGANR